MGTVRTQVYLDVDQYEWLRAEAYRRRTTLSKVLREAVIGLRDGGRPGGKRLDLRKLSRYVGSVKGGPRDVSVNHDRYAWGG